ncbi:hypothetical protein C5C67_06765 [Rathayibacter sp. AY1E1]|nr:hypothetical protein [Rathayibacter sp. AY1E1]PPH54438.1 hypothetical protein C5C67_06765 [Rathayibacter sp. AY1E1]
MPAPKTTTSAIPMTRVPTVSQSARTLVVMPVGVPMGTPCAEVSCRPRLVSPLPTRAFTGMRTRPCERASISVVSIASSSMSRTAFEVEAWMRTAIGQGSSLRTYTGMLESRETCRMLPVASIDTSESVRSASVMAAPTASPQPLPSPRQVTESSASTSLRLLPDSSSGSCSTEENASTSEPASSRSRTRSSRDSDSGESTTLAPSVAGTARAVERATPRAQGSDSIASRVSERRAAPIAEPRPRVSTTSGAVPSSCTSARSVAISDMRARHSVSSVAVAAASNASVRRESATTRSESPTVAREVVVTSSGSRRPEEGTTVRFTPLAA